MDMVNNKRDQLLIQKTFATIQSCTGASASDFLAFGYKEDHTMIEFEPDFGTFGEHNSSKKLNGRGIGVQGEGKGVIMIQNWEDGRPALGKCILIDREGGSFALLRNYLDANGQLKRESKSYLPDGSLS